MAYSLVPGLRTIELTPELLADPVAVSKLVREGDGTDTASEGLCEVALDCCGTKDALESCIGAAGIGGSVLMLGMGGGGRVEINVALAQSKEVGWKRDGLSSDAD
jgi:threonine dehydrogenase-like Zn-dependent dehydrogenase